MSLPIAGKPRPDTPSTHQPIDLDRLMKLGVSVEDAAEEMDDEIVTPELLMDLAAELGVEVSHLLAATAMTTDLEVSRTEEVTFTCCAGGCQGWGALDLIELLFDQRQRRADEGKKLFNIHARNCLDKCQKAPVVLASGPQGVAVIEGASAEQVGEAIASLCDE